MQKYGLKNPDGTTNTSRKDHISSVIVSVLQAGAFFGALTSAPVSGKRIQLGGTVYTFELRPPALPREQLILEGRKPFLRSVLSSWSAP